MSTSGGCRSLLEYLTSDKTELVTNHELQFLRLVFGLQAEIAMKADGKPGMSDEEVHSLTKAISLLS